MDGKWAQLSVGPFNTVSGPTDVYVSIQVMDDLQLLYTIRGYTMNVVR